MTAVFRNPLSDTRRPFSVSSSGRAPSLVGAAIALKAVADTVFIEILDPCTSVRRAIEMASISLERHGRQIGHVRDGVSLACPVVSHS